MRSSGVRLVAFFEAAKGVLVLLAGFGLLSLVHHDVQRVAERLVEHLHLNAAKQYPRIFLDAAAALTDKRLWTLAAMALAYAGLRLLEAYGLCRERRWAEWLAVSSGAIYVPMEVHELSRGATWIKVLALLINLVIVVYMIYALSQRSGSSAAARGE